MSQYLVAEGCEVSLGNHDTPSSKEGLKDSIDRINKESNDLKEVLFALIVAGVTGGDPKKLIGEEYHDIFTLKEYINDILETIECNAARNSKADIILENWDKRYIG